MDVEFKALKESQQTSYFNKNLPTSFTTTHEPNYEKQKGKRNSLSYSPNIHLLHKMNLYTREQKFAPETPPPAASSIVPTPPCQNLMSEDKNNVIM